MRRATGGDRWRAVLAAVALGTSLGLVACGGDSEKPASPVVLGDDAITVASFDFAESELLAEIYGQALEAGGLQVERALRLGPRELVAPALAGGLIELVPEYAGTALQFLGLGSAKPSADVSATHDALVSALEGTELVALDSAPAQDANAVVVTRDTADRHGLDSISDLASTDLDLVFGGPPECPSRPLCLAGLEQVYDLQVAEFVPLDAGGSLTREALDSGLIHAAILFTSDPMIDRYAILDDDRGLQPAENVTPLVHRDVVTRFGSKLVDIVNAVSTHLTTDELKALNEEVAEGRASAAEAAAAWLRDQGLT
jgi:osmoprotectant transport system substrate-binding protein